ncbi:unnamed protein product [Musa acuminata subsp. malaccensis]|uniref:(wild Malaysian banana) hypothetical protein n=1 Tax=Musa acuminata subsp. malaccensis TaxID=214687 RepID=A0A804K320_MUSAM|nr:unnamed protein product [Musa acuminata subsp. malaccensis]
MIQVHLISTIILSIASCFLFSYQFVVAEWGISFAGELCSGIVTEVKENDVRFHRYSCLFTQPLHLIEQVPFSQNPRASDKSDPWLEGLGFSDQDSREQQIR